MKRTTRASAILGRLLREDDGQDLVEYALLLTFFGVAFLALWAGIVDAVQTSYGNTTSGVADLWEAPPPGGS